MLRDDYAINGRKSARRAEVSIKHLTEYFAGGDATRVRALDITAETVGAYIRHRQDAKAKPATIQKELAALKRMFTLAHRAGRLGERPYIPTLEIRNTRTGFFEEAEFRAVLGHLSADVKPVVEFMYLTGWRTSEVLELQWRHVDFPGGAVRLEPGTTKNDQGRVFPFAVLPALAQLLRAQRDRTNEVERATGRIVPWVFHRSGLPIKEFRGGWHSACKKAGLLGRIPHDFRRTAVRNLERALVSRSVAMKLTGHLTESVYRRYAVTSEADLREGVARLAALHAHASAASRTVVPLDRAKSGQSRKTQMSSR